MKTSPVPAVAAALPLLFAATCDPETSPFRDVVVGLGLAVDRSWSLPLPQVLAPLATLIPLGAIDLRAAIMLALPAAIASYLVARRTTRAAEQQPILALAFAAMTAIALAAAGPAASLVVIACELAGAERVAHAFGAAAIASVWGAPRLAPVVLAVWILTRRPVREALLGAAPMLATLLLPQLLRREAWLALGNPLVAPSFSGGAFPSAPILRVAIVLSVLGFLARALSRAPTASERAFPIAAAIALACAIVLRAPGGLVVGAALLTPLAATFAGALSIAVERHLARPGRAALTLLVPALALGLGARAFEVEASARRLSVAGAAHDLAPIVLYGLSPPHSVLIVEDEAALLSFAHARLLLGIRPDLRVLPAQTLAAGGASRMTSETIAAIPAAADPLRALLARAAVEPADVAPLAQRCGVLVELSAHRLRAVARHAAPTGGPLVLALERVDPSDRRLRRPALERRIAFLANTLASRPPEDRVRRALRVAATREARVLANALDRDAASAALSRALLLGADPQRIARWSARISAKQTLESEPLSEDD